MLTQALPTNLLSCCSGLALWSCTFLRIVNNRNFWPFGPSASIGNRVQHYHCWDEAFESYIYSCPLPGRSSTKCYVCRSLRWVLTGHPEICVHLQPLTTITTAADLSVSCVGLTHAQPENLLFTATGVLKVGGECQVKFQCRIICASSHRRYECLWKVELAHFLYSIEATFTFLLRCLGWSTVATNYHCLIWYITLICNGLVLTWTCNDMLGALSLFKYRRATICLHWLFIQENSTLSMCLGQQQNRTWWSLQAG